jgi:hypothetical protein
LLLDQRSCHVSLPKNQADSSASHILLGYLDNPRYETSAVCAMSSLTPSLIAAQSTTRFGKDAMTRYEAWDSVDAAILALLQTHLQRLSSSQTGDAWTEGQAACDILDGLLPVVLAAQ